MKNAVCIVAWVLGWGYAYAIPQSKADLVVLNKVSARSEIITVSTGYIPTVIGGLSVTARICDKTPPESPPESAVYLEVYQGDEPLFTGWMFASDSAINSMEHSVYDIWLKRCHNGQGH